MPEPVQKTLTQAIHTLLRPLVRILLRNGIAYGSLAELAKKAYVDVAFEDFPPEGRKQTVSPPLSSSRNMTFRMIWVLIPH